MSAFAEIQKVGRAFMLPIATLPAAGLLLGIGGAFSSVGTLEVFPALNIPFLQNIFLVMNNTGSIVFANLPLLFAIAVPVGLAEEDGGTAALAGGLSFLIFHQTVSTVLQLEGLSDVSGTMYAVVLGLHSLQMGVFGGIIVGFLAVYLHNRYRRIELPKMFAFFSGARFVPIISAACSIVLGAIMAYIWPLIQIHIIANLGALVVGTGHVGTFIYGMIERALIPFGLHPIFYVPFWQTALGGSMDVCGQQIQGAQNVFFAQLACPGVTHFEVTQGTRFMTGKFPFMMFGLPGAALAMYQMAKPENRKVTGGLLISAAVTSFMTGITEPIEFTFLFVAPVLYGVHVVFAGLSFFLMDVLNVGVGQTFSGGVIDFTLFGVLQGISRTNWYWIPVIGVGYFFVYWFGFLFVIKKWDLQTPGREEVFGEIRAAVDYSSKGQEGRKEQGRAILAALGGGSNVKHVDACITRLRVELEDPSLLDEEALKVTGAQNFMKRGNGVQVIYGTEADVIKQYVLAAWHGKK